MTQKNFAKPAQIKQAFGDGFNTKKDLKFSSVPAFLYTQLLYLRDMFGAKRTGTQEAGGLSLAAVEKFDLESVYSDEHIESILGWCFRFIMCSSMFYSALSACMSNARLSRAGVLELLNGGNSIREQGATYHLDGDKSKIYMLTAEDLKEFDDLSEKGILACRNIVNKLSHGHTFNALPVITLSINHIKMMLTDLQTVRNRAKANGTQDKFQTRRTHREEARIQKQIDRGRIKLDESNVHSAAVENRVLGRRGQRTTKYGKHNSAADNVLN